MWKIGCLEKLQRLYKQHDRTYSHDHKYRKAKQLIGNPVLQPKCNDQTEQCRDQRNQSVYFCVLCIKSKLIDRDQLDNINKQKKAVDQKQKVLPANWNL